MTRITRFAAVAAAVVTLAAAGSPRPVPLRHLALKRAEPAKDTVLTTAPTRIALWFTQKPTLSVSKVTLTGPAGVVATAKPTMADSAGAPIIAVIPGKLAPGSYTVAWLTASSDGHPVKGEFGFTLK